MRHTREQKRTELLAAAQAVIEEFLDWEEQTACPKLTEIEEQVLPLRARFGQRLAEVALADQDRKQLVEAPPCPECAAGMRYKGQKGLNVLTSRVKDAMMGSVEVRDDDSLG